MKRKVLFTVIVLMLALICLTACNGYSSTLSTLTKLIKVNYSEIMLNVETATPEITLSGIYNFKFESGSTTVDYSYERLNDLSMDGSNERLIRVSGSAVVRDGKVIQDGVEVTLPTEAGFNISFKPAFFSNYKITSVKFEANVINPQGFTGNSDLVCSDMRVKVLHNKNSLTQLLITYVSENGSNVSITYLFTK